ncbi:MAG: RodZ domain-containing protein [Pseudomonadota bacterium]
MQSAQKESIYDKTNSGPDQDDMSVGDILRRTREHYGQSPEDVESAIRVRAEQIIAIEGNTIEGIPGDVYAIGFVRSYSEYLGLDGDKMVALFKAEQGVQKKVADLDFLIPTIEGKLPPKWLVLFCLFCVVAGPYTIWALSGGEHYEGLEIQEVPDSLRKPDSLSIIQFEPSATDENKNEVLLNIVETTWVEIKGADGEVLVSKVLESGEQYYVPNDADLKLTLSDGGAVQYQDDEGDFIAFGLKGEAMSDIPLQLKSVPEAVTNDLVVDEAKDVYGAPVLDPDSFVDPVQSSDVQNVSEETFEGSADNEDGFENVPIPPLKRRALGGRAERQPRTEDESSLEIIIVPSEPDGGSYGLND